MKTKLLLLTFLISFSLCAQTTYQIMWRIGTTSPTSDLTIEIGDTVEWVWDDTLPHTISTTGGSTESFDSGAINGLGMIYSHTFTLEGVNPYQCNFHPGSMSGTITVMENLSVPDDSLNSFSISPNPATSVINIKLPSNANSTLIEIFNVLGQRVLKKSLNESLETPIQISDWRSGLYITRITNGESSQIKRFVKL